MKALLRLWTALAVVLFVAALAQGQAPYQGQDAPAPAAPGAARTPGAEAEPAPAPVVLGAGRVPGADLDTDKNGYVDKAEWPYDVIIFNNADINANNQLDATELAVAMRGVEQEMRARVGVTDGVYIESTAGQPLDGQAPQDIPEGWRYEGPAPERETPQAQQPLLTPELFGRIDTNRDGQVSQTELQAYVSALMALDVNRDLVVTPEEAAGAFVVVPQAAPVAPTPTPTAPAETSGERVARNFLGRYDANGDGMVTPQEFGESIEAFNSLDLNRDGVLSAADFIAPRLER